MLTPLDCQAARGRLQWTRERLAAEAGLDIARVIAFELDRTPVDLVTFAALTGALEAAAVGFAGVDDAAIVSRARRDLG